METSYRYYYYEIESFCHINIKFNLILYYEKVLIFNYVCFWCCC